MPFIGPGAQRGDPLVVIGAGNEPVQGGCEEVCGG